MVYMILAGMLLNAGTLGSMKWLLNVSPLSYAFDLLCINEFGRGAIYTITPRGINVKALFTGEQVLDQFIIKEDDFNYDVTVLTIRTFCWMFLSYLLQRFYLQ